MKKNLKNRIISEISEAQADNKNNCYIYAICNVEEIESTNEYIKTFLPKKFQLTYHTTSSLVNLSIKWDDMYIKTKPDIDDEPQPSRVRRNKYGIYSYEGE